MLFMRLNSSAKKDFQSCQWNISTMMTASLPLDDFSTILDKSENESISEVFKLTDHLAWSSISFPTFLPYYEVLLPWLQKVFVLFFLDLLDWLLVILVCSGKASDVIDLSFCRLTSTLLVRHQHFIPLFDNLNWLGLLCQTSWTFH